MSKNSSPALLGIMKSGIKASVLLAIAMLLTVKASSSQNMECQLTGTVRCTGNINVQVDWKLQGNPSWNCKSGLTHINLTCKASEKRQTILGTRICCEVNMQTPKNTSTKRPASCLVIYNDKSPAWDCEFESAKLRILADSRENANASYRDGAYYDCKKKIANNNPDLQICSATKETETKNGASSRNETMKALGKTLIGSVTTFNCTASSVQKILLNIEDIVRPRLRDILSSPTTGAISLIYEVIELHAVVAGNMNKTINVPDNSEGTRQSQASISLSPGSIDIEHGRLGIVTVVFKFEALCNGTQELKLDLSSRSRTSSLRTPIVSVLAMTAKRSINALKDNATIRFKTKSSGPSTECLFLNHSSGSNKPFWSRRGMTFVDTHDENSTTCLTDHFTSFAVLLSYNGKLGPPGLSKPDIKALDLITKIGCGFAIVCLVVCILTFACVRFVLWHFCTNT